MTDAEKHALYAEANMLIARAIELLLKARDAHERSAPQVPADLEALRKMYDDTNKTAPHPFPRPGRPYWGPRAGSGGMVLC